MMSPTQSCLTGLRMVLVATMLASATTATGATDVVRSVAIESGEASSTLRQFVEQTGLQVLFDSSVVQGCPTKAVSGRLDSANILSQMLAESGLSFRKVNASTIAIVPTVRLAQAGPQ